MATATTLNLDELADAFRRLFGTHPHQQTPPGQLRDEQLEESGDTDMAVLTGDWALRLLEERIKLQNLDCMSGLEETGPDEWLRICLDEGLGYWPEAPFDATGDFWEIVTPGEPDEYFGGFLPSREPSSTFVVLHLLPLVVRRALEMDPGLLEVARVRAAAAAAAFASGK